MTLTREEALRLQREDPAALAQMALEEREEFVFAVRDTRAAGDATPGWGGELRVCLNQNLVLHFAPGFHEDMRGVDELPQFAVLPDEERGGQDTVHTYEAVGDLDAFDGVVFWVAPDQYRAMVDEVLAVAADFGERAILPDALFAATRFVHFVSHRVLPHAVAKGERPYDFTKRQF